MLADNLYGFAVLAVIAWVILIYFIVACPSRFLSGPRSRPFYRTPFRYEKASPSDLKDVGQQLHAVMAGSFER
jgi:hypothetical protein